MGKIYDLLPEGKANKITSLGLMNRLGVRTQRELCEMVRRERLEGCVILSTKANRGGYYRPGNYQEVLEWRRANQSEARQIFAMMKSTEKYLKEHFPEALEKDAIPGQVSMFDFMGQQAPPEEQQPGDQQAGGYVKEATAERQDRTARQ